MVFRLVNRPEPDHIARGVEKRVRAGRVINLYRGAPDQPPAAGRFQRINAGLHAGNADGASRDFFLAIQNQAVNYPSLVAGLAAPDTAQAGVWMNWRDRLSALNTTGTVPPNVGKGP